MARVGLQLWTETSRAVLSLLATAAAVKPRMDAAEFGPGSVHWAIATGLGPLLFRTLAESPGVCDTPLGMSLKAADLVARVETGAKLDALVEIIDGCGGRIPPPVLLKGISTCIQYYPEPHLRSMADIDLLIEERFVPALENVLSGLGYRRPDLAERAEFYRKHHHTAPFHDPERNVWVEIHRDLLPRSTKAGQSRVFSATNVERELENSRYEDRAIRRLSPELQLLYTSAHWAQQLHPGQGLMAMLDIVYLVNNTRADLDWSKVVRWMRMSPAAHQLALLCWYLQHRDVVVFEPGMAEELTSETDALGQTRKNLLGWIIDRYIAGGCPFGPLLSGRSLRILWRTLVNADSQLEALKLFPVRLILPHRLRRRT